MARKKLAIWLDRNDPPRLISTQKAATSRSGPAAVARRRFNGFFPLAGWPSSSLSSLAISVIVAAWPCIVIHAPAPLDVYPAPLDVHSNNDNGHALGESYDIRGEISRDECCRTPTTARAVFRKYRCQCRCKHKFNREFK